MIGIELITKTPRTATKVIARVVHYVGTALKNVLSSEKKSKTFFAFLGIYLLHRIVKRREH